jgi:hypothetical protein
MDKEQKPLARVQIPPYTDRWMRGDRYGEVVKVTDEKIEQWSGDFIVRKIAHVKLDKSGKTLKFFLDDCAEVD